jgi:nitroreductase
VSEQNHELSNLNGLIAPIRARYSPRGFANRAVSVETVHLLMEAARWAPSSRNEQPWRFVVARREDEEGYARIFDCLTPRNREWAHSAPVLMVSMTSMYLASNGKPNRHAFHDVGLAVSQMTIQAAALGLMMHQMGGFDREMAKTVLQIPEGFEPVTAIAAGYPREGARREKPRRPLSETVFKDRFGNPF